VNVHPSSFKAPRSYDEAGQGPQHSGGRIDADGQAAASDRGVGWSLLCGIIVAVERTLTAAVDAAAESLAALLDAVNHVTVMAALPVVATAAPGSAVRDIIGLARAIYAASDDPDDRVLSLAEITPTKHWRDLVVQAAQNELVPRGWVSDGDGPHRRFQRRSVRPVRQPTISAERIADAGRAAGKVADVIEANLGVVLRAYQVDVDPGERFYGHWWRDLLLVADTSATVLHMAFSD
jgi:hypothetical protein